MYVLRVRVRWVLRVGILVYIAVKPTLSASYRSTGFVQASDPCKALPNAYELVPKAFAKRHVQSNGDLISLENRRDNANRIAFSREQVLKYRPKHLHTQGARLLCEPLTLPAQGFIHG